MRELSIPPPPPSESSEKQIDRLFESSEKARTNSALTELRDWCKTADALKSFDEFEGLLLKHLGVSRQSLHRASAQAPGQESDNGHLSSSAVSGIKTASSTPSSPASQISILDKEAVISGASNPFHVEGVLTKSKTTGNLASLMPVIPKRQHFLKAGGSTQTTTSQKPTHPRKGSYFECSPETRAKAMKEREQRAARRVAEAHRRSASQSFSSDGPHGRQSSSKPSMNADSVQPKFHLSQGTQVGPTDKVSPFLAASALESGHGRPPPPPATRNVSSRVELVTMSSGGQEKVIRSKERSERQFSGDRVKSLLGAGGARSEEDGASSQWHELAGQW